MTTSRVEVIRRVGYMVLPQALRDDFVNAKFLDDRGCPTIEQAALAHFIENGGFERHLRYVTRELRSRRRKLIEGLHRHAGERVQIGGTHAGMHVVVWLPDYDHAQIDALTGLARKRGLGLHSVAPPTTTGARSYRVSCSAIADYPGHSCVMPRNYLADAWIRSTPSREATTRTTVNCTNS